jgi:hypothetical protein
VKKIVASRTLAASKNPNVRVVGDDIVGALRAEKQKAGGDIMIFAARPSRARLRRRIWSTSGGSRAAGDPRGGLPLFGKREERTRLELRSSKTFGSGVIAVHYVTKR